MSRPEHDQRLALSDDDSISLTSTAASEQQDEYAVDGIIAERKVDGEMQYLVRWKGYPDERCTWEPTSSFQHEETFLDWQTMKMRCSRGLENPCNIEVLLDRVEKWISSSKERKSRRRAKRIRLGIKVFPVAESDGEIEDGEGYQSLSEEQEDFELNATPISRRTSKSPDSTIPITPKNDSEEIGTKPRSTRGKAPTAVMFHPPKLFQASGQSSSSSTPKRLTDSPTKAVFNITRRDSTGKGSISPKNTLGEAKELKGEPREKGPRRASLSEKTSSNQASRRKLSSSSIPPLFVTSRRESLTGQGPTRLGPKSPSSASPTNKGPGSPPELVKKPRLALSTTLAKPFARNSKNNVFQAGGTQMGSSGRGPARLSTSVKTPTSASSKKRSVAGASVLKNWNKNVARRKSKVFHPSAKKTGDGPAEKFSKLSTMRRFEKRGRNEPAPNIESLTFLDLKHGTAKKPSTDLPNLITTFKTPYEIIQQGLENSPRDQINFKSPVFDKASAVTEALIQDTVALNDQDVELAEYSELKTASPTYMETVSAPLHKDKSEIHRSVGKKPSIPFQSYREQAAPPSTTSPIIDRFLNPQEKHTEIPPSSNFPESRTTAPRTTTTFDPHDNKSSSKHPITFRNLNTVQTELISSWSQNDILGTLLVGEERRILGDVRFRGLERFARILFLSMKVPPRQMHIWCQKICTIGEYQSNYRPGPSDYFGTGYSGFVVPFAQTVGVVEEMAEILKSHASCAVFNHASFSLLIYPIDGLESWSFLNHGHLNIPDGAALGFTLRKPLPQLDETEIDVVARMESVPIREGESNINMLMRNLLGIEYQRLIKQPSPELTAGSNNFFLFFIEAEQEYRIMYKFLEGNGAKIYSWDTEGAWDYFASKIEAGVILIEGSFWEIYSIPNLSRVLRKALNVFNITFYRDPYAPHSHINRLFPHGHAFLITDSFILLCPHEAARFFRWFRLHVLINKPAGTWKLCTRPHIREYVLDLVEARSVDEGHIFMKIYESLWYILPEELMDDEEFETPIDEAPVRCMSEGVTRFDHNVGKNPNRPLDEDAIAKNDATHVEWFAGWALTELETFRRFTVISGTRGDGKEAERAEWEGKWSHIDITSPNILFEKLRIPDWEAKDKARRDHEAKARQKSDLE